MEKAQTEVLTDAHFLTEQRIGFRGFEGMKNKSSIKTEGKLRRDWI